jgi:WD40 repeat protein
MRNEQLAMNVRLLAVFFLLSGFCLNAVAQDVVVFPQLGHTDTVRSVAFSPDGKQILSGSEDGTIKFWDADTGREINTFSVYTLMVNSIAFSPDGRQVLSGSDTNTRIKLWDANTGKEIGTFSGHIENISSVTFSPDGRQVLSGSSDKTIKLWDINTGREIRTLNGHTRRVNTVTFSPDGKQILSGSYDETIKLWDANTGKEIRTFYGHTGSVNSVVFSPDGRQILSGSGDNTMKLWDANTGREIRTFLGHTSGVYSVTFSPDGRQILSGSSDNTMKLWDADTGREIRTFYGHIGTVISISFSPDGRQVLSGSSDKTIKLWETNTGREIMTFSGHTSHVGSSTFSPDGKQVLSGSWDNTVKLWDVNTGQEIRTFLGHTHWVSSVTFSPDGKYILSGSYDKTIKLWDANTSMEIRTFYGHTSVVLSVTFSPDGRQILSGSGDTTIKLWDINSGREIRAFSGHTSHVGLVVFSPDGKHILSGSGDGVKLWDVNTGKEIRTFSRDINGVRSVRFSPDGKQVISGSNDNTIKLWDANTGREIRIFSRNINGVASITFSPDGKQVLFGSDDNSIKLWDVNTGREIRTFSGHTNLVNSVIFSPDGKQIISGSYDGTIRLWDVSTGKEIAQFISFNDGEWISLTPDGYYNSSPNGDKYLNVRVGNNVYGIDQFRGTFYNPQIVEARLQGRRDPIPNIPDINNVGSPPEIVISNPQDRAVLSSNQVELSVTVIDQKQYIKTIMVSVNGKLVGGNQARSISAPRGVDLEIDSTQIQIKGNQNRVEFKLPITLDPGVNKIEVKATNSNSLEGRRSIEVTNRQASAQNARPNLYILAIGVNRYNDTRRLETLKFAVNDAKAIVDAFKAQAGKRYGKVEALLIADGEKITPTGANILNNFNYLRQAGPNDVVLLFIAGHGMNDQYDEFYFLPSDAAFGSDGSILVSSAISSSQIQTALSMSGQKLVFIDTCHSGGTGSQFTQRVDNERLIQNLNNNSAIRNTSAIFTSSRSDQQSLEIPQYSHGIFTYAILQGLKGEADTYKKGVVTTTALELYLKIKIPELAESVNRQQNPVIFRSGGLDEFEMVILGK